MTVPVETFGLKVTLQKTAQHKDGVAQVWTSGKREFDLTRFLGSAGGISTTKSIAGEPAGGFVLTFADQVSPDTADTVYALAEAMDVIEIRASRTPWAHAGGKLPLIMRGFITTVTRTRGMGGDGRPMNQVTIAGHDFGKLWMVHGIWFETALITDQPVLSVFQLQAVTGIETAVLPVAKFMEQVVEQVMNPKVEKLSAAASKQIPKFTIQASVKQGCVVPNAAAGIQPGPLWGIIARFADRPWNEVFVLDQEDGPVVVFRPAPLRDLKGNYVIQGAKDPGTVLLEGADIVRMDMAHSDIRVANFFWVPPGQASLDTSAYVSAATLINGDLLDFKYGNNDPAIYGEKRLDAATNLVPDDISVLPDMLTPSERNPALAAYPQWYSVRAAQLKAMNRDNSVFEEGHATVRGREDFEIGKYLQVNDGDLTWTAYMVAISHQINPLATWTTSVMLERGTGFYERNKMGGSPYWSETRTGPYS